MKDSALSANKDVNELHKKLGYIFKRPDLIAEAFRHSSYTNELGDLDLRDNERLEFLGDAVLDLAIGHILMELFPDAKEGDLSKYRAIVVSEKGLSQVAKELGLGEYLLLGRGEELTYGREKPSILANTIEALIGALYLDAGFTVTKEIIHRLFSPLLGKIELERAAEDYKSLVQEYTQQKYKTRPDYVQVRESGPAHNKIFRVALSLDGKIIAEGEGKTKKEAEQEAAREAFFCLTREREET
jgi:ribonuclease III